MDEEYDYDLDIGILESERQDLFEQISDLSDEVEVFREANAQLAEKIKMLDLQKENAELKLKDFLVAYRLMKKALEFYADAKSWRSGGSMKIPDYSNVHQWIRRGGNKARKALKTINDLK